MPVKVMLVEDDDAIAQPLHRALEREGYEVLRVSDGAAALDLATAGSIDLVLLDLGLPDMDGMEVCRRLREKESSLPILMVTARGDELDRVVGLDPERTTICRSPSDSPSSTPACVPCSDEGAGPRITARRQSRESSG